MLSHTEKQSAPNKVRLIFYLLWLSCSLVQATFSNLIPDETLYWKYSQQLAWGYFEHAPGIALFIKAGNSLFHNELGVRLSSILFMCGAIYFVERIIQPRRLALFYMSVASIAVLHILAILAVPDAPLFFFTASFLLLYKKYLMTDKWYLAVLLSVNTTLLLLSKYHGILIIFFAIISNLQLLRRRSFWFMVLLSFVLFLPHIIWQFRNGFPTIVFNLFERDAHYVHDFTSVLNYLGSVPAIFLPFTGVIFLYYALRYRVATSFERTLKFILTGTLVFFFFMSLRGRIEANWILCTIVPVLYMGYHTVIEKSWGQKLIRVSFTITIILVLVARTILIDGLWNINLDTTKWKQWAKEIQKHAAGRPVAFMNSYQKAGEYEFYTGERSFSLNNVMGRKDQYNLWNDEDKYQGKDIMVVTNYYHPTFSSIATAKGDVYFMLISNFRSSSNIEIEPAVKELTTNRGDSISIKFTAKVREGSHVDAEANEAYPMHISYELFKDNQLYSHFITDLKLDNSSLDNKGSLSLRIKSPAEKGDFKLFISVSAGWLPASITGGKVILHNK